jgi:hypothetical protein
VCPNDEIRFSFCVCLYRRCVMRYIVSKSDLRSLCHHIRWARLVYEKSLRPVQGDSWVVKKSMKPTKSLKMKENVNEIWGIASKTVAKNSSILILNSKHTLQRLIERLSRLKYLFQLRNCLGMPTKHFSSCFERQKGSHISVKRLRKEHHVSTDCVVVIFLRFYTVLY